MEGRKEGLVGEDGRDESESETDREREESMICKARKNIPYTTPPSYFH